MPYVFGGGGGGAGANLPVITFKDSVTYTPAWTSEVIAYVIGAGGSGGAARDTGDWTGGASGGGAGGTAISRLTLTGGVSYTITIGAGGARKTTDADDQALAGAAGGNTSLSGSDISTMTANGGTGGAGSISSTSAGGTGGSASGGNIANLTGGAAGNAGSDYRASGGGGVSLWTTTPISVDSGSAPAPGGSFAYSSPANSQYSNVISPGAQPGARTDLGYVSPFPFEISSSYLEYDGSSYEYGAYSLPAGHIGLVPRTTSYSYHGSPFTGGIGDTYGQSSGAHAAAGQFGSGGGGAVVVANSNHANSGAGGDGVVFFITQTIS